MSKKCLTLDDVERLGRESGDWRAAFYTLFDWLKDKTGSEMKLTQFANSEGLVPQLRERSDHLTRTSNSVDDGLMSDAAYEIERLRAALEDIGECECSCESGATCISCRAREALL